MNTRAFREFSNPSTRVFTVSMEATIIHRSDTGIVQMAYDVPGRDWRAIVRIGSRMEWQWFEKREQAEEWVQSWRTPGKTLCEIL